VYGVLGKCGTQCQLMIMTSRDGGECHNVVLCDDGRAVDENERDGG